MYSLRKKLRYSAEIAAFSLIFIITLHFFSLSSIPTGSFGSEDGGSNLNVIIDPGHGGEDGGAVSLSGMKESEVNLDIALRTRLIMSMFGVTVTMTRDTENINYPSEAVTVRAKKVADQKARLDLIKSLDNAVLISIHQNYYTSAKPFGAEALYAPTAGSENFAINMQEILISALNENNYRKASKIPENIFLMNNISCPAVLVECGFLSNPAEDALLKTDEYKLKIAAAVASGYFTSERLLKETFFGGLNESENDFLLY